MSLPKRKNVFRVGRSGMQYHSALLLIDMSHAFGRHGREVSRFETSCGTRVWGYRYTHSGLDVDTSGREGAMRDALSMEILHSL